MPKYRKEFEEAHPRLDVLFENIRSGDPDRLVFMYGEKLGRPLHLLSDAVRSFIWAAPGHEFINVDYTSIEGVFAAWIAGEEWKLDAFKLHFAGSGPGMYELTAAGIYGIPVEAVDRKIHRPTGKVAELSCQYQTGVGGIRKFARQNKVNLPALFPALWKSAEDQQDYVAKRFEDRQKAHDPNVDVLGREGWIAAELIKMGWRTKHPAITAAWSMLEEAATEAVRQPGTQHMALGVKYLVKHNFLWALLPSGRALAYGAPRIEEVEAPWADKTVPVAKRERKRSVTAKGVNVQNEKWERSAIYGGSLFNNVVQGSCRDILVNGINNAEAAGYPIVLHTHDEFMGELPIGQGSVKELEQIAGRLPDWCKDLPLKASGWRGKRYRKD